MKMLILLNQIVNEIIKPAELPNDGDNERDVKTKKEIEVKNSKNNLIELKPVEIEKNKKKKVESKCCTIF